MMYGISQTIIYIDCTGAAATDWGLVVYSSAASGSYKINFKYAGTRNNWCYIRQIGGENTFKLALDFHDDVTDARFCIRNVFV